MAETGTPPLAADHQGMRVSARGALTGSGSGPAYSRREMADHLEELARRYYAGNVAAVDEFLQLYSLGREERKAAKARAAQSEEVPHGS